MMMMPGQQRETLAETLLNTLEAERYMRGPLLLTLVDELRATEAFAVAALEASAILQGLQSGELVETAFMARLRALRRLIQAVSASPSPESGIGVTESRDSLARAPQRGKASAA